MKFETTSLRQKRVLPCASMALEDAVNCPARCSSPSDTGVSRVCEALWDSPCRWAVCQSWGGRALCLGSGVSRASWGDLHTLHRNNGDCPASKMTLALSRTPLVQSKKCGFGNRLNSWQGQQQTMKRQWKQPFLNLTIFPSARLLWIRKTFSFGKVGQQAHKRSHAFSLHTPAALPSHKVHMQTRMIKTAWHALNHGDWCWELTFLQTEERTFNKVCSLISLTWAFNSNLQCYEAFLNILQQPDNFYFLLFIHWRNFVIDFNELCINTVVSMYVKSLNVGSWADSRARDC